MRLSEAATRLTKMSDSSSVTAMVYQIDTQSCPKNCKATLIATGQVVPGRGDGLTYYASLFTSDVILISGRDYAVRFYFADMTPGQYFWNGFLVNPAGDKGLQAGQTVSGDFTMLGQTFDQTKTEFTPSLILADVYLKYTKLN